MNSEITFKAGLKWEWQDGEGCKCFRCGDSAWLKQLRAFTVLEIIGGEKILSETEVVLCAPCGDSFMSKK